MENSIKRLSDREQARQKLPIFFGSRDNYVHPIKEAIANAVDELKNNDQKDPKIIVTLSDDQQTVSIKDNGRGIPIIGESFGEKNYKLLFQTLFAGTKYDVTSNIQTGTNGVGMATTCMTSKYFECQVERDGIFATAIFENGGELISFTEKKCNKDLHSSLVKFALDDDVYTKTKFIPEDVKEIVKHFSIAANGIKFVFIFNGEETEYLIEDYCEYFKVENLSSTTSAIFTIGDIAFEQEIEVLKADGTVKEIEKNNYTIILTTTPEVVQESYLNMTYLEQGGSINRGVLDGIRLHLNKYCRDNKLFPTKVTAFSKEDVESSISFLAVVESNNVEFSNQTKLSTEKKEYEKNAKEYVTNLLIAFETEQPKDFKKLVSHILEVQKHNNINTKAREKLKKKLGEKVEGINNRVDKLVDCEKHGMEAELFVTEGDSANGSITDSRDDEFQAAYPLRGKLLNTLKSDLERTFKNEEIVDLVKIIGTGITDSKNKKGDFDISKTRFGKIICTTDSDPDGQQISVLILVFIYRFMRPLLDAGMVYAARTPLYELKFEDDSVVYFLSEDDKNKNIGKYVGKKYTMNRLKGLGEVDAHTMRETAMNPETRKLVKFTVEDAKKAERMLLDWMDNDVEPRKKMINEQLPGFIDLSE